MYRDRNWYRDRCGERRRDRYRDVCRDRYKSGMSTTLNTTILGIPTPHPIAPRKKHVVRQAGILT